MTQPAQTIGPYLIRRRLSEGGMGALYACVRAQTDETREVAIKIVTESFASDPRYLEAFRRESETAARLDHPNIVQVIDRGEDAGRPYLVMELLHGRSLADVFSRGRTLNQWIPADLAVFVIRQAAIGLHYLHEAKDDDGDPLNVAHGDISPQNIFITHDGEVKLIDFGLAHAALPANDDFSPSKIFGKVHYLAPEQARGRIPDRLSDVFSLGATLYEALTTQSAFSAASKYLVLLRITQGEADPIRSHLPEISPELATAVDRCLRPEPEARFTDAAVVAAALTAYLETLADPITTQHLAAYLTTLFGDDVDGSRPADERRASAKHRLSTGRRITDSINTVAERTGLGGWLWMLVGAGLGILLGLGWVLHQVGLF